MSNKQPIGDFSLKAVTMTFTPGPAGSLVVQANFEGTATGFGAVMGTMNATPAGQPNGTFDFCVASYPDDGNSMTGIGRGTLIRHQPLAHARRDATLRWPRGARRRRTGSREPRVEREDVRHRLSHPSHSADLLGSAE